ncbi:hypothetical protein ACKW6Q_06415 [Chryseobacterium kwangjuense]|uniref:Carboxypeptidase regulatory-like domain-containing protein n=1 Tax=Chryseobacterium kwangjuense TaxID=267125 RepID=A0ABW9K1S7_9FLAO
MKKNIIINNPCSERWEDMQDSPEGKFCEKCSKCIIDFTDKTDQEFKDIFAHASGREICGKISSSSFSKIVTGVVLVTHLSFVQAQVKTDFDTSVEQKASDIKVSGRLVFRETQKVIPNAEVFFIAKNKFIKSTTNENGYFSLSIPDDLIKNENVLYLNFDKLNEINRIEKKEKDTIERDYYGNQAVTFSNKEKIENRKFQIDYKGYEIGAVIIVSDPPPDYYYFDGKNISKEKFEKLRKQNPQYPFFSFEGKEADIISQDSFIDKLYLLYSK